MRLRPARQFTVNNLAGCAWQAISNAAFITITAPVGGQGSDAEADRASAASHNSTSPRSGTITVNGQAFTVLQGALFLDVPPAHPFYTFIGKLSATGITQGRGVGYYCPEANVTREQMAVFLIRAKGEQPSITRRFNDVGPERFGFGQINRLFALSITLGCGGSNYCPDAAVTCEQVALFLLRALGVFTPPAGPTTPTFADVPNRGATDYSYEFIEEFYRRGVTSGWQAAPCLYCPAAALTRGQMAVFLVRAFGLKVQSA